MEPTDRRVDEIKSLFDFFDRDKSGSIDAKQLGSLLQCIGQNPTQAQVKDMIKAIDLDNNGSIEWQEFLTEMQKRLGSKNIQQEVQAVFQLFDRDGTQAITKQGIFYVMTNVFKQKLSLTEAQDMVRVVAGTKNYITYAEFRKIMLEGI